MWINDEIDIPEELFAAQRDGRLVIFAGAGVSMGPPSNLPDFADLATGIAAGVLARAENEPFDLYLGRLAVHGVDVQKSARRILNAPGSQPSRLHNLIVDLFRTNDNARIVTTNFDSHFTTVARARFPKIDVFNAPALPLGRDFSGLVYVHGSLERREPLVLTDADFGRAYLIDGYATRFLTEMFSEYVVLFVGYSHQDVVMQYLARAFIRAKDRFAFSTSAEPARWRQLRIVPIVFPFRPEPERFAAIDDAFEAWVARTKMGLLDHETRIAAMVQGSPPLAPDLADYARGIMKSVGTLQFLVRDCTSLEWFKWLEHEGLLSGLTSPGAATTEREEMLATWAARTLLTGNADEGIDFLQRHAGTLHPRFSSALVFYLARRMPDVPADVLKPWVVAIMALDLRAVPHPLSNLLDKCRSNPETIDVAFLLFQYLLRPRVRLTKRWSIGDADSRASAPIELELLGDMHELRDAWSETLRGQLSRAYRSLFGAVTAYLEESLAVDRAARASDAWDRLSFGRSAIEPNGQDRHPDDWEFLVDVARDVLEWMLEHDVTLGTSAITLWEHSESLVLKRLAIHGWGRRTDAAAEAVLKHIEDRGWLYGSGLKHEVYMLLKEVFPGVDAEAQERLIRHSMSANVLDGDLLEDVDVDAISAYERYNLAAWLKQIAPESETAQNHFAALQAQHPDFGVRDHVDFDHYVGDVQRRWPRSPLTAADLVEKSADDAIDDIMSYVPDPDELRGPSREGLLATLRQAATENYSWSESVADTLMARGLWDAKIWGALLEAWRASQQGPASWANVLTMIDEHFEIVQAAPSGVAGLLERIADADGLSSDDLDRIERIGEQVLPFSNGREPSFQRAGRTDWLTSTINHPAGHIALSWLKLLSAHMATDRSGGIPPAQRARYEALLGDQGPNGLLARVAFASHAHFLFSMDAEWTTAHVLPFFDWSINPDRAEQAWSGFLTWGDWTNDVFFDRMRPQTIQTFSHLGRLEQGGRPLSTRLAAAAVYSVNDPWVGNGWLFEFVRLADADNRHEWARSFGQYLQSLSSDAAEQLWHRWVLGYCRQRGEGAPRAFDDRESDAMVEWPIGLKNVVEEVVNTFEQVGAIPSTLQYYTLYRLRESHLAESHGSVMGRYLRILLSRAQSLAHACDEVFALATDALTHGAERDDVRNIAEAMARLACPNAGQLRDKANGP